MTTTTTFIDTNKLPRVQTPQGEATEILNNALVGAKNVVGTLRWLKSGEQFQANPSDKHQLIYLMEGKGSINQKGNFKISGTVAPMPLKANLHVLTRGIDCAVADSYVSKQFNTALERALLSMNGAVAVDQEQRTLRLSYRGRSI